mmetsp:Transcript_7393/g.15349  ORF Transcript_7393/g.15349 Transcript_7393/m.15349 type:complete len:359 (+) Transcript_7393:90-1166(+)
MFPGAACAASLWWVMGLLMFATSSVHALTATHVSSKHLDNLGLDNRKLLTTRSSLLFVKFHKVGGSTMMRTLEDLLSFNAVERTCDRSCGLNGSALIEDSLCSDLELPNSCLGHASLDSARAGMALMNPTPAVPEDLTDPRNLQSDEVRRSAFLKGAPWSSMWLREAGDKFFAFTLLRDPAEKLRSKFFWHRRSDDDVNLVTFESYLLRQLRTVRSANFTALNQKSTFLHASGGHKFRPCCEYVDFLGDFSVNTAKQVLATQFNLVGITERFDETLVTIAHILGFPVSALPAPSHDKDNGDHKEDWTNETRALAEEIVVSDRPIYEFATQLFSRQLLSAWSAHEAVDQAVRDYHLSHE